jgi:hypothetical protein
MQPYIRLFLAAESQEKKWSLIRIDRIGSKFLEIGTIDLMFQLQDQT